MKLTLYKANKPTEVFKIQTTRTLKELSEFLELAVANQQPIRVNLFNGSYLILQYSEYADYRILVSGQ